MGRRRKLLLGAALALGFFYMGATPNTDGVLAAKERELWREATGYVEPTAQVVQANRLIKSAGGELSSGQRVGAQLAATSTSPPVTLPVAGTGVAGPPLVDPPPPPPPPPRQPAQPAQPPAPAVSAGASCPSACGGCRPGGERDGGQQLYYLGFCTSFCSPGNYCGNTGPYRAPGSTDCSQCGDSNRPTTTCVRSV